MNAVYTISCRFTYDDRNKLLNPGQPVHCGAQSPGLGCRPGGARAASVVRHTRGDRTRVPRRLPASETPHPRSEFVESDREGQSIDPMTVSPLSAFAVLLTSSSARARLRC